MKTAPLTVVLLFPFFLFGQSIGLNGSQVSTQLNTIATAVPFLLITPDARAGGLGDAGCSGSPDVYSNFWNVSKNAFATKRNGIAFSWTPWLRALVPDINLWELSSYKKIGRKGALGFSARYFSLGEILFTNITGIATGNFRPFEHSESLSYSTKLRHNCSAGLAVKYIHSQLVGHMNVGGIQYHPGRSVAMDFSFYQRDTVKFNNVFAWGVNISNIGSKMSYSNRSEKDFLPQNLKLGVSYKWNVGKDYSAEFILDAGKLLVPSPPIYVNGPNGITVGSYQKSSVISALYTSFYDAPRGNQEEIHEINIGTGVENWFFKAVAFRLGYFYEHPTKGGREYLTLGLGGRYKGLELDANYIYALEKRHPLHNTFRFTLSWEFDRLCKKKINTSAAPTTSSQTSP